MPTDINLVFGASGYIGTYLTPLLRDAGKRVRASSRNKEVLEGRQWNDVELIEADALSPETLDAALTDVDTAYYLVHSMAAGKNFPELDAKAARNFAAAAARQHVRRIVYLGGLLPSGSPDSAHLRSREETGDILRAGTVPVTEIRAGMIIGPGSAAWEVIRDLVNHLPVMVTPRWVKSLSTPIALDNLLHYLANVAELNETANETYDVGGPDVLTYAEIMRRYGALVGKRPLIFRVPVLTPRLSSYWLRLVTSVPTDVARALIDGLSHDVIAHDQRLENLIPQKLLGFDEAAKAALDADRQHDIPAHWVENASERPDFHPQYSFYAKKAVASIRTDRTAEELWTVLQQFGHDGDFFYGRVLWWLRRALDWLIGGPSFRRRRRHPNTLRVGDVVDVWRVIDIELDARLTLLMEMRAPGAGVLEFGINDEDGVRELCMQAYWHPAGAWGLLYWYLLLPIHRFLFERTVLAIVERAADAQATSG
ncbi:MAG: DUF2867 domain-containing protein [Woeseiaceae bacterium]|nr:DUF2867 domain-containing protein [Woeseiaceae bacterium]